MSQTPASFSSVTKILVPLDFSDSSHASLAAASEYGEKFHAEIEVLHVIATTPDFNGSDFFPNTSRLEEVRSEVETKLESYTNDLRSKGIRTSWTIEAGNDVAESIVMVSKRDSADMLVISTHGMSGWQPLLFGSITEKVLKHTQCPLLLLRTDKPVFTDTESMRSDNQQ
jgi:nucleotide-binding universal stress UspA family protein